MPRARSFTDDDLKDRALRQFWTHGYDASSMDLLVAATGISRHGIYKAFGGKHALYLACFEWYQQTVVSPAFERVERQGSTLADIRRYFEHQIQVAEGLGLPGPGCFVGNAATEIAPHDAEVRRQVHNHNARLQSGFAGALRNSAPERAVVTETLARMLLVFATGLWALSRVTEDADELRAAVTETLALVDGRLRNAAG